MAGTVWERQGRAQAMCKYSSRSFRAQAMCKYSSRSFHVCHLTFSPCKSCRNVSSFFFQEQGHAQVMDDYSSRSFRLLAGAAGVIRDADKLDMLRMTQQQVEACATNMQLLCLVVLTNSVRKDSRQTISELQDG